MAASRQIALPLQLARRDQPLRIVIGSANEHVVEALSDPSTWPFRTAILTGPERSGKSLLGEWFAGQSKTNVVIDGADGWDEDKLFHRWNRAQEEGTPLLLIADRTPWQSALPDLKSRLGAALQLEIGTPDDDMIGELILAIAEQRGLALGPGAPNYLVPRLERSFAGIERVVGLIDRLSLERKSPPSLSIWRDALEAVQGPEQANLL